MLSRSYPVILDLEYLILIVGWRWGPALGADDLCRAGEAATEGGEEHGGCGVGDGGPVASRLRAVALCSVAWEGGDVQVPNQGS